MHSRIIEGAIEETGEKGIKFTMNDLAKRLGVSKRTIYEKFNSKEEIIEAIVDKFLATMKEKEEEILNDPNLTSIEKLKAIAMILPNDFKLMYFSKFYEMKRYYPKQWQKIEKWAAEWEPETKLIEEGIGNHQLRKVNTVVLRKIVVESTMALLDRNFLIKNDITLRDALHAMVDIILYGLVKDERKDE
ncbi:TetR/AcrR family transcriptional regulator [Clostridiaceae bacterium 35-E11]